MFFAILIRERAHKVEHTYEHLRVIMNMHIFVQIVIKMFIHQKHLKFIPLLHEKPQIFINRIHKFIKGAHITQNKVMHIFESNKKVEIDLKLQRRSRSHSIALENNSYCERFLHIIEITAACTLSERRNSFYNSLRTPSCDFSLLQLLWPYKNRVISLRSIMYYVALSAQGELIKISFL